MQFDCCASPMSFSSMDLSWVVAMWAGFVPGKDFFCILIYVDDGFHNLYILRLFFYIGKSQSLRSRARTIKRRRDW